MLVDNSSATSEKYNSDLAWTLLCQITFGKNTWNKKNTVQGGMDTISPNPIKLPDKTVPTVFKWHLVKGFNSCSLMWKRVQELNTFTQLPHYYGWSGIWKVSSSFSNKLQIALKSLLMSCQNTEPSNTNSMLKMGCYSCSLKVDLWENVFSCCQVASTIKKEIWGHGGRTHQWKHFEREQSVWWISTVNILLIQNTSMENKR